jgi:hypothetical protein
MTARVIRSAAPAYAIRADVKAINVDTEARKAVYWRAFERTRSKWYGKMARLVGGEFAAEKLVVVNAVSGASRESADAAVRNVLLESRSSWERFLAASYLAIGEDFAPATISALEGSKDAGSTTWMKFLLNWINTQSGLKITQIQGTTLDAIRRQLSIGMQEGETMEQIAARIGSMYDESVSYRAMRIARTEVVSASNASSIAGARSVSDKLSKRWLSSRDARVRTDHSSADGQTVGMDEPFSVGGYELMFPGDGSRGAPASEIVNCRCTVTYVRK